MGRIALQNSHVPAQPSGTKRRQRRSAAELTNRLLQAAAEEFKRAGYAGATTAAIARKADVTEAQLFRYFGSKSNLFREAIFKPLDEQLLQFTQAHMPERAAIGDWAAMAALYIGELQRFVDENAGLITSLIAGQTYEPQAGRGVETIASLGKYFEHGASIMRARTKGKSKVPPKLMVRVSFAAVLACAMFKDWIFPPGLANDKQIRKAISDFVLEGIGANYERGREGEK
jgi:AcrR family transcriptional regulator